MTKRVVNLSLIGLLLGSLAIPALADGNPIPWPKTPTKPTSKAINSQTLLADGNPIPWPKTPTKPTNKIGKSELLLSDGNPIPWPTTPPTKPTATVRFNAVAR